MQDGFVYCNDEHGLLSGINCVYEPSEWRLFIDSSVASLKRVLLAMRAIMHPDQLAFCFYEGKLQNHASSADKTWLQQI